MHLLNCTHHANTIKCNYNKKELKVILDQNDLTLKQAEDFSGIIQLLSSSDLKNKRLAIKLSRVIYRFDCYDLCHYLRKLHIMKKKYNFDLWNYMRFLEMKLSGYEVGEVTSESQCCDYRMIRDHKISLYSNTTYEYINFDINDDTFDLFHDVFINKKNSANPYRNCLLKYS